MHPLGLFELEQQVFCNGGVRVVAIAYAVLTIMSLIPATNTTFGLVPIYGHDIWLHALLAAVAAYFVFAYRETSPAAART